MTVVQRRVAGQAQATRLRIVLAEDDPADALLVEELLADGDLDASLTWVRSAADARRAVAEGAADCLVLDLHLPDLAGIGALAEFLREVGVTAVVVMTGLDDRAAGLAAVQAGAQDYLVKGKVEGEWFARTVRYAVQRKQAGQAAAALAAARWRAQENARLERGLLPTPLLRDADIEVACGYRPSRAGALLGGDFYDVIETADGDVHAVVGDVSGHGPDEAALGAGLRVGWRTLVMAGHRGADLLRKLEQLLLAERRTPEAFATLVMATFPRGGGLTITRAGHPGVLLRSERRVRLVEPEHGPALGLVPGVGDWPQRPVDHRPEEALVMFTDGLYETRLTGGERLGEQRLTHLADTLGGLPAQEFVDTLIDLSRAEQAAHPEGRAGVLGSGDDVAVLYLQRKADV
ncbi:PP2C family protein-serine/threonine phosphatase [Streptacidiphilus neutrinimicus]|uniref:PP2C family protein-serine/threonine phosphatase n=1 Tax=Streptacidiphilus neutrinimicus TaxID=105420 RepID=UPI001376DAA8|nr:fused response regulator/phosphatase [Streptacidiphilus neutrinimicus]